MTLQIGVTEHLTMHYATLYIHNDTQGLECINCLWPGLLIFTALSLNNGSAEYWSEQDTLTSTFPIKLYSIDLTIFSIIMHQGDTKHYTYLLIYNCTILKPQPYFKYTIGVRGHYLKLWSGLRFTKYYDHLLMYYNTQTLIL